MLYHISVNGCFFTNTDAYDCVLLLQRDGETVAQAPLETHVPPLSEERFVNPFAGQTRGGEYAVTVSFRLREDKPWARRGDEMAFGQGTWKVDAKLRAQKHAPLRVVVGTANIGVHGDHFTALFGKMAGGLIDYKYGGVDMIRTTPMPNFWRAPTDNDRGNLMPQRYAQWKLASMYATNRLDLSGSFPSFDVPVTCNDDGSVTLKYVYTLPTSPIAQCAMTYTVYPCGRVNVVLEHDPVKGLSEMPEFGVMFTLSADFDQLRYYGLGPDENTIDRHEGAKLGIWQRPVKDMMTRYLIPQECGGRTGVRWAEVTDYKGRGLRFIGDGMTFSALPWSPHELENARHSYELPPIHNTVVRCILQQVGVAGDDSWGARPHDEYLIDVSKPLRFEFAFEGKL